MATQHPQIAGLTDWTPLARGGFATVWKARQATLDRSVAVKIDQRTLDEEKEQRRFLREAGAAGRLSGHPGIVTVHDAGILPDDRPYLVMELCPGGSLTQWMKPEHRPTQRRVRDVGVRIADALAAAHARGVLHRDVKPGNILIDSYDNPGLADFGLAAIPEPGTDISVTMEALTPAYAPREVFYQQPPNEYGDVFSLAATLYALLGGKPPRWPDQGTPSLPEILELQREPVVPIPGVEPELMDVIMRGLADDADARPSAAEFRDLLAGVDLEDAGGRADRPLAIATGLNGSTGHGSRRHGAPPAVGAERLPGFDDTFPPSRRRSIVFVVVGVLILAVLTASTIAWVRNSSSTAQPPVVGTLPSPPSTAAEPSPSVSTTEPSPSPTTSLPAGFVDCAELAGGPQLLRRGAGVLGRVRAGLRHPGRLEPGLLRQAAPLPDLRGGGGGHRDPPAVAARQGQAGR